MTRRYEDRNGDRMGWRDRRERGGERQISGRYKNGETEVGRDEIDGDTGQRDRDGEREEREINIKELTDNPKRETETETIRQGLRKNGKDRCSRGQRQKRERLERDRARQ